MAAQFRPSRRPHTAAEAEAPAKDAKQGTTMETTKTTEQSQDSRRQNAKTLDECYGKIGISAVAAAVRHQGELRNARDQRVSFDAD